MMRKLLQCMLVLLFIVPSLSAQPQLVVVISLDQVPFEHLARFEKHFGQGGFRLLLSRGANFVNASYEHATDITGPGHAVMLSGTYGDENGIIANTWYDMRRGADVYCVSDPRTQLVGAAGEGRSPANLISSTFGDELRITSGFRSKVISVSHKNRAAILLGGHLANGVYWMVDSSFVTSTYYMPSLPTWVTDFNRSRRINSYFGSVWKRVLSDDAYDNVDIDDVPYESGANGLGRTFPHRITGSDTSRITSSYYSALLASPYGNELLETFAKEAVTAERLGGRGVTDLLCISFSSTDYVGHAFGPHSREILEMMVRADRVLADLFTFLDHAVGLDRCVIALTSDHGVAPIPEYLKAQFPHVDAGRVSNETLVTLCQDSLKIPGAISRVVDRNIYVNRAVLSSAGLSVHTADSILIAALRSHPAVADAFELPLRDAAAAPRLSMRIQHSTYPGRSGDVVYLLKPFYLEEGGSTGTSHGDPYEYNAHVPLLIMGPGIATGTYFAECSPVDLAPTLSALIRTEFPTSREGRVLHEALVEVRPPAGGGGKTKN